MKKIEYNRDIKRKWMLLVICFLALLIIIFGCQSSKLKKIDKEPPVIELYSDTIEITEGDEYSPGDNVKSVKDNVDGDITKVDNNLNETGKAYYFIDSSKLDASKVGEYSVKVIARDKAGNEVTKEFTVKVLEKKDDNDSSVSTNNGNNQASNNKENAKKFADLWSNKIGKVELVYTKNAEGRKELLKARMQNMSVKDKMQRKQKLTDWK